ncbi:uncharacterized mitochondrial protein AtMg00860-like [Cryptomeria japonica]|uniref:uncharacterized mitochondrial protein AtMg00860-like n=1 Tax=Cryptomeria japonica TaxID=3369 RepID=UPI0025ABC71B|nr:uncharacterized mitochondrial protein AtMg00860-like [Cryptomeria japonica]
MEKYFELHNMSNVTKAVWAAYLLTGEATTLWDNEKSKRKLQPGDGKVHYLGHVITVEGISVDPAKIEAIVDWPTPQNVLEIQSFMGLAGYYKKYVEGFSRIATPITSLQKKEKIFEWTKKCEDSFQLLKQKLTTAPVLTILDPNGHLIVIRDASGEIV